MPPCDTRHSTRTSRPAPGYAGTGSPRAGARDRPSAASSQPRSSPPRAPRSSSPRMSGTARSGSKHAAEEQAQDADQASAETDCSVCRRSASMRARSSRQAVELEENGSTKAHDDRREVHEEHRKSSHPAGPQPPHPSDRESDGVTPSTPGRASTGPPGGARWGIDGGLGPFTRNGRYRPQCEGSRSIRGPSGDRTLRRAGCAWAASRTAAARDR